MDLSDEQVREITRLIAEAVNAHLAKGEANSSSTMNLKIISRAEAKRKGLKHYYTGKPCPSGHIAELYVSKGHCVACSKAQAATWQRANPKKKAVFDIRWAKANSEKREANRRKWDAENPEARRAIKRNRRARKRGADGISNPEDIERLLKEQKGKCAYYFYCETVLTPDNMHRDHIVPLIKGGSNWPDNIQLTCQHCNNRKNDKDPEVFLKQLIAEVIQRKMGQAAE